MAKRIIVLIIVVLLMSQSLAFAAGADEGSMTVEEKVEQVVSSVITPDMSDRDKALALHDWLTDNAYYDRTLTYYSEEGVLLYGTGVCQSYANAYKLLLNKAGIESVIITGWGLNSNEGHWESHAWNLVNIDGVWSHVDVTWDDPVTDSDVPKSGSEQHLYFLVTTNFILQDHSLDEESEAMIEEKSPFDVVASLPDPVDVSARVEVPDFTFEKADGKILTKDNFAKGKRLIMVYGRTTCYNTRAFVGNIAQYINLLEENNVTVLLALYDEPSSSEMKEMEELCPGVVCTKVTDYDNSMWEGLWSFNADTGGVVFPVVFLKNANNAMTYYSTGYVDEPARLVAGAIQMGDDAAPASQDPENDPEGTNDDGSQTWDDTDDDQEYIPSEDDQTWDDPDDGQTVDPYDDQPSETIDDDPVNVPTGDDQSKDSTDDVRTIVPSDANQEEGIEDHGQTTDTSDKSDTETVDPSVISEEKANTSSVITVGNGKYKLNKKNKTAMFYAPKKKSIKKIVIPATVKVSGKTYKVTSIRSNAFKNCKKLTSVSIGKYVTSIGKNAFYGCKKLKTVKGCVGVKSIKSGAFMNCKVLTTAKISNKVTSIGSKAFYGCSSLKTVTIGKSAATIGKQAFYKCSKLKTVNIKSSKLKKVYSKAFKSIYSKAKIKVPKKKLKAYKKLLKGKIGTKAKVIAAS